MNILLSGGSGFIGSYFIKRFLDVGADVDIISRKIPTNLKNSKILIYDFDITKPNSLSLKKKYDLFIHLAAANDIDSKDPIEALMKTTYGTRNCLDLCLKNNIKKFIYFSTLQVFGSNTLINDKSPIECNNDYAITHYFSEEYVRMYKVKGIDYIIVRPSNVYGDFESKTVNRWSLVPSCFCKSAMEDSLINLMSSGKQKRDFISLEDVYGFTLHIINNYESCKNKVYNLASGDVHSIFNLAELVQKRFEFKYKKKCDLIKESKFPLNEEKFKISVNRIKNSGYVPTYSSISKMEATIDSLLEFYR